MGGTPQPPGGGIREAEILSAPPAISYLTKGVQPPALLYVGRDDRLRMRVWNSVTGLIPAISGRLLRPDGQIIPFNFQTAPTSDRVLNDNTFDLTEGFLLSVIAGVITGAARRGQTFLQLWLDRGGAGGAAPFALLLSDYLVTATEIGWPGGALRHSADGPGVIRFITGTDPAVNTEIAETVPTNARWRLLSVSFNLVTDANAADREVELILDDGTTAFYRAGANATQAASLTRIYSASAAGVVGATAARVLAIPLPSQLIMAQGDRILTNTISIQVGDDYSAPVMLVEEWIEE